MLLHSGSVEAMFTRDLLPAIKLELGREGGVYRVEAVEGVPESSTDLVALLSHQLRLPR